MKCQWRKENAIHQEKLFLPAGQHSTEEQVVGSLSVVVLGAQLCKSSGVT